MSIKSFKCDYCGKEFVRSEFAVKNNKNKFCSKECANLFKITSLTTKCHYCGKEIVHCKSVKRKYCNEQCKKLDLTKIEICANCGKEIRVPKSKKQKKYFCNKECYIEFVGKNKLSDEEVRQRMLESNKKSKIKHREQRLKDAKNYYWKNRKELKEKNKIAYKKRAEQREKRKQDAYKMLMDLKIMTDCIICGYPKEKIPAIEFHHINPKEKNFIISRLVSSSKNNKEKFINEAKKCVCLCANCHRLLHNNDEEVVKKYKEILNNGTV